MIAKLMYCPVGPPETNDFARLGIHGDSGSLSVGRQLLS